MVDGVTAQITVPPCIHAQAEFTPLAHIPLALVLVGGQPLGKQFARRIKVQVDIFAEGMEKEGIALDQLHDFMTGHPGGALFFHQGIDGLRGAATEEQAAEQGREQDASH